MLPPIFASPAEIAEIYEMSRICADFLNSRRFFLNFFTKFSRNLHVYYLFIYFTLCTERLVNNNYNQNKSKVSYAIIWVKHLSLYFNHCNRSECNAWTHGIFAVVELEFLWACPLGMISICGRMHAHRLPIYFHIFEQIFEQIF